MEFNEVENLSEPQILELYSDVAETGNFFVAANDYYDYCSGSDEPAGLPPYCDSRDNHIHWIESCMRCYDSNHDGTISQGECTLYGKEHVEGLYPGGKCPSYGVK